MFKIHVNPSLVWDNCTNQMVPCKEVVVQIVGNKGTVYAEAGPLFVQTGEEIFQAVQTLKVRLTNSLMIPDQIKGSPLAPS